MIIVTTMDKDNIESCLPLAEELEISFNKAAVHLQSLASSFSSDKLLYFYARYKQAIEGPCNIPKPGFFDFKGKQKWEAWNSLGNMNKDEAMKEYVDAIAEVDPEWELNVKCEGGQGSSWVRVSSLQQKDDQVKEEDKNSFDWVKENNLEKIKDLDPKCVSETDVNGMTLLHWAADRGFSAVAKCLLDLKIDVNAQDAEGQTALHYATSCGHIETVKVLLQHGADAEIQDADGMLAKDCADDENVQVLFKLST